MAATTSFHTAAVHQPHPRPHHHHHHHHHQSWTSTSSTGSAPTSATAGTSSHANKITKSRGARSSVKVKPILRKLHSSSHSDKNSLDLDRPWEDQQSPYLLHGSVSPDYSYTGYGLDGYGYGHGHGHVYSHSFSFDKPSSTCVYPGYSSYERDSNGNGAPRHSLDYPRTSTAPSGASASASPTTCCSANAAVIRSSSATPAATGDRSRRALSHASTRSSTLTGSSSHARSTSGASSHISTATTNTSGPRNGSFVHPFQQTPRTSTPPLLSYATSLASLGAASEPRDCCTSAGRAVSSGSITTGHNANAGSRDYSPTTITEDDHDLDDAYDDQDQDDNDYDDDDRDSNLDSFPLPEPGSRPLQSVHPHSLSHYRHPSNNSQRTTSFGDPSSSSLRLSSSSHKRQNQPTSSPSVTVVDESPSPSISGVNNNSSSTSSASPQTSNPTVASPMSPLRTSLDMTNFRIRSRSDVDTATRQEQVRVARRKFEEREKAKDEKYAREQVRKRERADNKEHQRALAAAHSRKSSFGTVGRRSTGDVHHSGATASGTSTATRPQASRRSTGGSRPKVSLSEKPVSPGLGNNPSQRDAYFPATTSSSHGAYEDMTASQQQQQQRDLEDDDEDDDDMAAAGAAGGAAHAATGTGGPTDRSADDVRFEPNRRSAKRKTTGTWTAFVLWFRTRLLKLGRR